MPNFHMHWLVALQAIDSFGKEDDIAKGRKKYLAHCGAFRKELYSALENVELSKFQGVFHELARDLDGNLRKQPDYDSITCFSAYMLGACGPDFWTLMSKETFPPSGKDTAGLHFDLGHYNRTHQQFIVSGERLRKKSTRSLTDRAERAYFAGMATHVATDLLIHELVNVYAGAYNILKHCWVSEHGFLPSFAKLWSTHNKVEHFWDTYVRYRWLGDYGTIWNKDETAGGPAPLGLPLTASLLREARRLGRHFETVIDEYSDYPETLSLDTMMDDPSSVAPDLTGPAYHVAADRENLKEVRSSSQYKENKRKRFSSKNTYLLERLIMFPRIFCDRMLARDGLEPFIYDVVVKDQGGAYPSAAVFDEAVSEKTTPQMQDILNGGQNEGNKLRTFSSRVNLGDGFSSFNFQVNLMCPNLERLREYRPNVFWEPKALPPFIEAATGVAKSFARAYTNFADDPDVTGIGVLDNFWNLDTGLGIRVENVRSESTYETRTRIKFLHVTEETKTTIGHSRENEHIRAEHPAKKEPAKYDLPGRYRQPQTPIFSTVDGDSVPSSEDIHERDSSSYLRTLKTQNEVGLVTQSLTDDQFFNLPGSPRPIRGALVPTNGIATGTKVVVPRKIASRLSLELEASIVQLGAKDATGFALYGDRAGSSATPQEQVEHACEKWIDAEVSQCLRFIEQGAPADARVKKDRIHYTGRLFANFNHDTAPFGGRKTAQGKWNNLIDPVDVADYCGKNFAVATLRKNVLSQNGSGRFWPTSSTLIASDFGVFTDLAPTEQVFVTLFPIVSTHENGCYDVFSHKSVSRSDLDKLRKIRCVGFVPIVLLFIETSGGFAQLDRAYVDGLEVPVVGVNE